MPGASKRFCIEKGDSYYFRPVRPLLSVFLDQLHFSFIAIFCAIISFCRQQCLSQRRSCQLHRPASIWLPNVIYFTRYRRKSLIGIRQRRSHHVLRRRHHHLKQIMKTMPPKIHQSQRIRKRHTHRSHHHLNPHHNYHQRWTIFRRLQIRLLQQQRMGNKMRTMPMDNLNFQRTKSWASAQAHSSTIPILMLANILVKFTWIMVCRWDDVILLYSSATTRMGPSRYTKTLENNWFNREKWQKFNCSAKIVLAEEKGPIIFNERGLSLE